MTVVCTTEICTNFVQTTNSIVAHDVGVYCERCRIDRKRQLDREYHERNREQRNARRRVEQPKPRGGYRKRGGRIKGKPGRPPTLTEEQVKEIRQRLTDRKPWSRIDSGPQLAKEFGVSIGYLYDLKNMKERV